ncbi:MAG TPA: hypothetical protein VIL37_15855 [Natronosporangium sp.]|jgi:hypothetical protein
MRLLVLYLRSRRVPLSVAAAVGSAAALWSIDWATQHRASGAAALLAVVAATLAAGPGLAGADTNLDRTAAIAWLPRRAVHAVAACAAVIAIVAATGLGGEPLAPTGQIVRDAAGMSGLLAAGAVGLGASRAWIPPLSWLMLAWTLAVADRRTLPETALAALTWMLQPAGSTSAAVVAAVLGTAGTLGYAVLGPRR